MIACVAHWYTSMLYVAPVLVVGGYIAFMSRRDRRRRRAEEPDAPREERSASASVAALVRH
ncbi:MAG TPA: hypothetical protein VHB30_10035 [Solirubrobacteraceae bacterium]|jgi:hypothetical protein|nr:hypothetical protein [Solirubrobacteraceae bacterium]